MVRVGESRRSYALKGAVKAEQVVFRLKRELQKLELSEPEQAPGREGLPDVRGGGNVIDVERLRR